MAKFKIELQLKSTEENSPRILLTDFDSNNESNSGITFEETLTEEENDLYTLDFQVPHILENGLEVGNLIKVGRVLWLTLQDDRVIKMIITNFSIDEGNENWIYSVSAKDYASYIFAKTSVGLELDTFTDEDFWDWMGQKGFEFTTIEDIGNYILDRSFLRDHHGWGWKVIDKETFKAWNLDDYQLVENGDLTLDSNSDGAPDGFTYNAATNISLTNGIATFTATAQYGHLRQTPPNVFNLVNDNTYYIYSKVKTITAVCSMILNGAGYDVSIVNDGNWQFTSKIFTASSSYIGTGVMIYDESTSDWAPIEVDYMGAFNISQMKRDGARDDNGVLFSDLTNEEIKTQLDLWISKGILLNDDSLSANTNKRARIEVGNNILDDYQLVENGDLTLDSNNNNVPDGFYCASATDISLVNGIVKFTATEKYGRLEARPQGFNAQKAYTFAYVKADGDVRLSNDTSLSTAHSGSGQYEFLSLIETFTSDTWFPQVYDNRTSDWRPIEVDYIGAYNISQMELDGVRDDNGVLFSELDNDEIKAQLDIWVQNNKKIIASVYNISVSNSNLYNALVELANISNRTFKIDYIKKEITFYEKDDEIYDKNYQLVDKLNIQDSSLSYNGEELYGLFYVLGAKNLEDSYVFLQDETEYKDSFIYDFSYFKDAGFLSQEDIEDINGIFGITNYPIPSFWEGLPTLKEINEKLQNVLGTLYTLESNLFLMEGRIKSHIENALADGEVTAEELGQVDALFEYWAQEEGEYKTEIKENYFSNYDWSIEPKDYGLEENRDKEDGSTYIRWEIPTLSGASFRYGSEIININDQMRLNFWWGNNYYVIAISTIEEDGYSPIYYGTLEKQGPPKLYYRVSYGTAFQPLPLQVISTQMIKTYKYRKPILKRKMPYFELLYQIGGNELISKKLEEIEKEIEEYKELWIEDQKELDIESRKSEKDESKITILTQRIKGYTLIIGEHTYNSESETPLTPTNQPGWKTTLKRIYEDFLDKWEADEFDTFRANTPILREQKRDLLQQKQNFWYTLKEKYGRSTFAEGYYENELELNSKDLMNQAKAIYESHKKPTEDFSITYIDISDIIGLNMDQIKVGDFIKIKKDKYNIQTNSYSKIKVSSISRTLREDANIQLTINRVNLLDKLLEKIIATSQQKI